jgi:hypothetical protein
MKNSINRAVVKPFVLYIFLGSIFIFAMVLSLASCTSKKKEDPQPGLSITSFTPASGAVGSTITIVGTSFDEDSDDNTVVFNGTPGQVSASSMTTINVVVPPEATTGKISVTVNGKTVISAMDFAVQ